MNRCVACRLKFNKIKQDPYHNEDSQRIMKCSRITLSDRKEKRNKDVKHNCNYQRDYNPKVENYISWLNKSHSAHEERYLTIYNLVLPNTISADRGAMSERWVKKRPRLQSAKQKCIKNPRPKTPDSESEDDAPHTFLDDNTETDSQLMEIQQVMEEYEIDENVQRLIQEAAEYDQRVAEEKELKEEKQLDIADELDKRKYRKTSKNKTKERNNETKEKARSKLTRTVTLSLSRPPSPETIQVIRVDVTSNYSMEESDHLVNEEVETDEEENEKNLESNRLYGAKSFIKCPSAGELTLQCQKLALADRRGPGPVV